MTFRRFLHQPKRNPTARMFCRRSAQYNHVIDESLGDFDKSGIAELAFKDRHKHSGNRVCVVAALKWN